jgi:excisionase family DNA binding protein
MRPVDPVTLDEAARILGCSKSSVRRYVMAGQLPSYGGRYEHRALPQADVERLAAEVHQWRRHRSDADSYWLVGREAA